MTESLQMSILEKTLIVRSVTQDINRQNPEKQDTAYRPSQVTNRIVLSDPSTPDWYSHCSILL